MNCPEAPQYLTGKTLRMTFSIINRLMACSSSCGLLALERTRVPRIERPDSEFHSVAGGKCNDLQAGTVFATACDCLVNFTAQPALHRDACFLVQQMCRCRWLSAGGDTCSSGFRERNNLIASNKWLSSKIANGNQALCTPHTEKHLLSKFFMKGSYRRCFLKS